ncbi:hypothetical protein NG697_06255 [Pseudarthrobacter sp. MDT3-26]|nr:hypothetical protein [Pseudarthrobacter sp. MDT3-26]MCO4262531.1 hypothetical protein [Pseudarthrobacter sp. MDT3-26]
MQTKQHACFCDHCGRITNHVTHYVKADGGGQLIATVQCAEHAEEAV